MVRTKRICHTENLLRALLLGTGEVSVFILIALAVMAHFDWITWGVFGAVFAGLAAGVIIGQGTEYFTSDEYGPTRGIAKTANSGPATTIIEGFAVGMFFNMGTAVTVVMGIHCSLWTGRRIS